MSDINGNCLDKWWLFELPERDHWLYEGMRFPEMFHLFNEQMTEASKLCRTCPVFDECLNTMVDDDVQYSMRAGIGPLVSLGWQSDATGSRAPQCPHNPRGDLPVCGQCLHAGRKTRDYRLRELGKSGSIEDISRSTD